MLILLFLTFKKVANVWSTQYTYHTYALFSNRDLPFLLKLAWQIVNGLQHKMQQKNVLVMTQLCLD